MLLLPLLIWAATLIGCVQPYKKHECGKKYTCLAPKDCLGIVEDEEEGRKFKIVAQSEKIKAGCTLLLRFHQYDMKRMRVILETEDTSETYRSIDVQVLRRNGERALESLFSCVVDKKKAVGRIGDSKTDAKPLGGKNKKEPLRCEFDAVRSDGKDVWIIGRNDDLVTVLSPTDGTKNSTSFPMDSAVNDIELYCNPDRLIAPKPSDPANRPTERYAPMGYDLGTLACPFPAVYRKKEYRTETGYKTFDSIKCSKEIVIDKAKFEAGVSVEVRCVADADYFCDYDVKAPTKLDERTQKKLNVTKGDPTKKVPRRGRIECPANYPYFVMGSRAPVIDYNLTCRTKLTKQLWHYGDTAITKDGPIVYCTNALSCPKLAPTSFDGSYLDKDNQPTCQKDGTLQLKKGGSTIMDPFDGRVECNEKTGWMGYLSKGQWQRITDEVFYCHYINRAELKDKENNASLLRSIASVVGGTAVVVGLITIFGLCWLDWSGKKKKREAELAEIAESARITGRHNEDLAMLPDEKGDKPRREFEAVRSMFSLCGKTMPLRRTAEHDPEPITLIRTKTAWSLPRFTITSPELLTECPRSGRATEEALFEKVFAKMDEGDRAAMAAMATMWAHEPVLVAQAASLTVNRTSRAEALFNKMKAEGQVTGEYVPVTAHPSWASEARAAAIAARPKPKKQHQPARNPQPAAAQ